MRATIVVSDNIVVVDGEPMKSDLSELAAQQVSAVQWYDTEGEVEYARHVKPNEAITDFAPFQIYIDNADPLAPPEPTIVPALDGFNPKTIATILGV
ncbi:hypothetical protein J4G43_046080 [Bradyrhizobium barranii subsp. barranii]|uniref:Uncharacterized protein n=1 Tax=Bradyrhizobium barranii subsp. barranii TaxID=2823807 RepID=A0A939MLK3_9BRAD|nr:hypothetical protein [Bradyrhizobium barranii]UEM11749.1 hypothetical protein J4G43_046080 [Bradyrhizobium barranii subsp. barranii]